MLSNGGGAARFWADPNYAGWSAALTSPCAQNARAPDRVVLDVTRNEFQRSVSVYETARQLFGEEAVGGRRFERVLSLSLTLMQGLALLATHEKIDSPDLDGVWARYRDELARLFNPVS